MSQATDGGGIWEVEIGEMIEKSLEKTLEKYSRDIGETLDKDWRIIGENWGCTRIMSQVRGSG
jgi:hypothetical protein